MTQSVYVQRGTPLVIRDSGGDYVITASSLAAGAGRYCARMDLGALPHSAEFDWYMETAWATGGVVGEALELRKAEWDNDTGPASPWAQVGASDAAFTAGMRYNTGLIGPVYNGFGDTTVCSWGGRFICTKRYLTLAIWNGASVKALAAVGTTPTIIRITPFYPQLQ